MFNFYVVLAGHDMVTDTGSATTCRSKFKDYSLQKKGIKNEEPFENIDFNGKQFEDSDEKKHTSSLDQTTPWNTLPLNATIDDRPYNQEEMNCRKIEKAFRLKLWEISKTKAKKSSPDTFKFYVVLAGDDKATGADRATGCRRKLKAPSLQKKVQKMKDLSRTWVLTGKSLQTKKIHF